MHRRSLVTLSIFSGLLACISADAAEEFIPFRPTVRIARVTTPPTLDDFLSMEPSPRLQGQMTKVSGFTQRSPEDGAPSANQTDVYMGYDERNFYVVFVAFDDEPDRVRARMTRRENINRDDDLVYVNLDTFNDERRGYEFGCNAHGIQFDSLFIEGGTVDRSFDTLWYSRGQRTDQGFVVWFALPFDSLRYPDSEKQTWGILLERWSPHSSDWSFWPQASSRVEGYLNQTARIEMENVSPGRNRQFIPYGLFRSFRALDPLAPGGPVYATDPAEGNVGLDAKMVIKKSLVFDGTVNPDFSQVESDEPQVTVNQRFEVFFPEKRPFFIENAQYFQTPINLVFTRRIADPRLGARLTGKTGPWAIGAIVTDDEAPGKSVAPGSPLEGTRAYNTILRLSRDVFRQGNVGALFTDRELEGASNRVGGADFRFKLDANWALAGQAVASSTTALDGRRSSGPAYTVSLDRSGRSLQTNLTYLDVSEGFVTATGFVTRRDIRQGHFWTRYLVWPESERIISWGPSFAFERVWDQSGTLLDTFTEPSIEWNFPLRTTINLFVGWKEETLRPQDFGTLVANRVYSEPSRGAVFETSLVPELTLRAEVETGTTIHFNPPIGEEPPLANVTKADVTLTLRPGNTVTIDNRYLLTSLSDRDSGARIFDNHILRSKWNWQLNRELSIRVIAQYDALEANEALSSLPTSKNVNFDLLVTYLVNPGTALYVGYNGNAQNLDLLETSRGRETFRTGRNLRYDSWQWFAKFSYLLRF